MIATTTTTPARAVLPSATASSRPVALADSQTWSVEVGSAGVVVRCLSGAVWLTREGDPEDHVLTAPAVFKSARRGRLVLFALGPSRISVEPSR